MDKTKIFIYVGIFFILIGIILRYYFDKALIGVLLIILGAISKLIFLFISVLTKKIKIGYEIFFLILGLLFVFIGIKFKATESYFMLHPIFMSVGVILKIIFVVLWINKMVKSDN